VSGSRDAEYSEYVAARLSSLRRLAGVLCDDWQHADDLVQGTLVKLYVHWGRAQSASHPDAYARAILVREFIQDRRSGWARRVRLSGTVGDSPAAATDHDAALDLRAAVATLPPGQRATLVLRFYCDLNVEQSAAVLGCSTGTVKSQTARGLAAVREALAPAHAAGSGGQPTAAAEHRIIPGGTGRA
jgi:RNA polymerase sigma-70 factor (sigma-E family)